MDGSDIRSFECAAEIQRGIREVDRAMVTPRFIQCNGSTSAAEDLLLIFNIFGQECRAVRYQVTGIDHGTAENLQDPPLLREDSSLINKRKGTITDNA